MTSPPNSPPPEQQQNPAAPPVITTRRLTARLADISGATFSDDSAAMHVTLIENEGDPPPAATEDPTRLLGGTQTARFRNGEAAIDIVPNSRITPADTRYEVTLSAAPMRRVVKIAMPDRDAELGELIPRPVQGRALRLSTGGVLLLNDGSRLLI